MKHNKEMDFYKLEVHKAKNKDYESIVVGYLLVIGRKHKLQIKCQQPIRMADGKLYLIDLYFPGIKLAIECDEGHHLNQVAEDVVRQQDIEDLTGITFMRVNAHGTADEFFSDIALVEEFIENNSTADAEYDYESELTPIPYTREYLKKSDAAKKFGHSDIKLTKYSDSFSIDYDADPISCITVICYPSMYKVAITYDGQYDNVIKNNINKFKDIPNVDDAGYARTPCVLRLNINNSLLTTNRDASIDMAVDAAVEAKKVFMNIIKE